MIPIPHALEEGARIGKYLIRRQLGQGGMGEVYLAEDTLLAREVAVKVLVPALDRDPDFIVRFREEARAVSKLMHPHIVHINSLEILEGQFVIDMEYVSGPSLDRFLMHGDVAPSTVLRLVAQVLQGLAACHERGIVHRDIKPTNVLLTLQGQAKVSDFGIAKAFQSHMEMALTRRQSSGFYLGTPHYAPPELWEAAPATPAWDVYSVGVLLYQALSGQLPYDAASPFALIKQIQCRPAAPLGKLVPSASSELASCVHGMLDPNPEARPCDGAEALRRLTAVPESAAPDVVVATTVRVPRARAEDNPAAARKRTRPRRWVVLAAVVLLVSLTSLYLVPGSVPNVSQRIRPRAQDTANRSELLTRDALLTYAKRADGPVYQFFDTTALGNDTPRDLHWMMDPPREGRKASVVAATDRSLWLLDMTQGPSGMLSFGGDWGGTTTKPAQSSTTAPQKGRASGRDRERR